jgi:hypothetical protein
MVTMRSMWDVATAQDAGHVEATTPIVTGIRGVVPPRRLIVTCGRYTVGVAPQRPRSVSSQAADNLTFIRSTMERASTFTSVSGIGGVAVGVIGLVAAIVGARQPTADRWLVTWLAAAVIAAAVEVVAMMRKAYRAGMTLTGPAARRFALGMAAPLVAGAAITYALWAARQYTVMTPAWLLLYGTGVLTGGMFSVPVVRAIGICFMTAGIAAVVTPPAWGNVWLAIGFGGLHIGFGAYIARNHGG